MYKRIIAWIIVLAILGFFTYREYEKSIAPNPEKIEKGTLNIYTDIDGYEKTIKEGTRSEVTDKYNLNFLEDSDIKMADIILTDDATNLKPDREYRTIAYSPMVVMMRCDDSIEKYKENGLLIKEKDENEAEIDFKKIMDAVMKNETWSCFGGEDKPIKVYCPQKGTADANLFYQFLLITANNGVYPTTQAQKEICEQMANDFLDAPMVEGVDIVNRVIKVQDIGCDIYVMPEADYWKAYDSIKENDLISFIAYPTETVIKEIYYQTNGTDAAKAFDEEFEKEGFLSSKLSDKLTETRYRNIDSPGARYKRDKNNEMIAKEAFNYIEIPKGTQSSVITE